MARSQRRDGAGGAREPEANDQPAPGLPEPRPETGAGTPHLAESGPTERVYAVAFDRVWLAALEAVAAMGRWTVTGSDPVRGEILVETRGLIRKTTRPARVRLALDPLGLTRVDATFLADSGDPAAELQPRQIARFHRLLETRLRGDSAA
jgi:hypothetical protein